jgi:hypothetical protein
MSSLSDPLSLNKRNPLTFGCFNENDQRFVYLESAFGPTCTTYIRGTLYAREERMSNKWKARKQVRSGA